MAKSKFKKSRNMRDVTVVLDYEDTDGVEVFKLPAGARLCSVGAYVKTAFSGGTTTLSVVDQDGTALFTFTDISTTGVKSPDFSGLVLGDSVDNITELRATIGAGNSAGKLNLMVFFSLKQDTPLA